MSFSRFLTGCLCVLVSTFLINSDAFSASIKKAKKVPTISAFSLVDGRSGSAVAGYENINTRVVIPSKKVKGKELDLQIKRGAQKVSSVKYIYFSKQNNGSQKRFTVTRNKAPFSMMKTDRKVYQNWTLSDGSYEIHAVAYSKRRAKGKSSKMFGATIIVENSETQQDNIENNDNAVEEVSNTPSSSATENNNEQQEVVVEPVETVTPVSIVTPLPTTSVTAVVTATPVITPTPVLPISTNDNFCVWANDGGDKVIQEDLRMSRAGADSVKNSVWNGTNVNVFAAKNETVSFNLVVEAAKQELSNVSVKLDQLSDGQGHVISTKTVEGDEVFNYVDRNIEIFTVKYLTIKGLSLLGYESSYDERHVPARLRRGYETTYGRGYGSWTDRQDHDKSYPDIAVPQEIAGAVTIAEGTNQSFWFDVYVPNNLPAGKYTGTVKVYSDDQVIKTVPVALQVKNFTLPEVSYAKTMLYFGYADVSKRYVGQSWPSKSSTINQVSKIRDRHFQMAHRHRIAMIDSDDMRSGLTPSSEWQARLDGSLFTANNGYAGPGVGQGNGVYSVGTYGSWNWQNSSESVFHNNANTIASWFSKNAATTDYFLYLIDESSNYAQINTWINKFKSNTGIGQNLRMLATIPANVALEETPNLDIVTSTRGLGISSEWEKAAEYFRNGAGKDLYFYNGNRPQSGSFMTEDDGVALRQVAWTQYKMNIARWFYWESTYYNNYQVGAGETNVFKQARTFGKYTSDSSVLGQTGDRYSNGDGVLFYPGTDKVYPEESYGVAGPIASLRLKHWRRGIQDVDYLNLAAAKNPAKVKEIVQRIIPKVLWEYGVNDINDPTYVHTDISWSNDPDVWEAARAELAAIIEQ